MKKENTTIPRLGIDFGNTIVGVLAPADRSRHLRKEEFPEAVAVIRKLAEHHFGEEIYVISKVSPGGKEKVLAWMEKNDFYCRFGIPSEHVFFCAKRHEKGPIAERLGLTHFIDDRPEVMMHMRDVERRILFNPVPADYALFKEHLDGVEIVNSWSEVGHLLIPT